ncbi:MAG: hypothetical protein IH605_11385 [Burkholderiales bacterium]|nr:hypothetical protein [Burkholderiales bacterium]
MNQANADTPKALSASGTLPHRRLLHEIRFLAGVAIALGGAGVLLSDLIRLMPLLG